MEEMKAIKSNDSLALTFHQSYTTPNFPVPLLTL